MRVVAVELTALLLIFIVIGPIASQAAEPEVYLPRVEGRRVALTFDDLPAAMLSFSPKLLTDRMAFRKATEKFLRNLQKRKIPVAGFVNEGRLPLGWSSSDLDAVLLAWLEAGAEVGNHTSTHPDLYNVGPEAFKANVILGEARLSTLLAARNQKIRFFRHPYLHTGESPEVRADIADFLRDRGYQTAPITFDIQDWLFGEIYSWAKTRRDEPRTEAVVDAYFRYLAAALEHFALRTSEVLGGRQIAHVALLHVNALNFDHIERLIALIEAQEFRFISLEEALKDPAYQENVPSAGSWIHGWEWNRGLPVTKDPDPEFYLGQLYDDYQIVKGAGLR